MKLHVKGALRRLEQAKQRLAKERDALRDIQQQFGEQADNIEEGMDNLQAAIDVLSYYV